MIRIKDILSRINYDRFTGDDNTLIKDVVSLSSGTGRSDVISWCSQKNISSLKDIKSGTVICPEGFVENPGVNYIVTSEPRKAFRQVLENFFAEQPPTPLIEKSAFIDHSSIVAHTAYIGHNTVIEKNCTIGERVVIGHNNVLRAGTVIGNDVKIGCNNTIGGVGFGYEKDENGVYKVIPHIGNVLIEDLVEIGNNNTIDRAVLGSTILRKNSKIDNLVHIAHGVEIGENSLVIANAMVAGSVKIGKNTWVAPSSSVLNGITVGEEVTIGMGAVVLKPVADKDIIVGNPARSIKRAES